MASSNHLSMPRYTSSAADYAAGRASRQRRCPQPQQLAPQAYRGASQGKWVWARGIAFLIEHLPAVHCMQYQVDALPDIM